MAWPFLVVFVVIFIGMLALRIIALEMFAAIFIAALHG
jgi:hypothetical protein